MDIQGILKNPKELSRVEKAVEVFKKNYGKYPVSVAVEKFISDWDEHCFSSWSFLTVVLMRSLKLTQRQAIDCVNNLICVE